MVTNHPGTELYKPADRCSDFFFVLRFYSEFCSKDRAAAVTDPKSLRLYAGQYGQAFNLGFSGKTDRNQPYEIGGVISIHAEHDGIRMVAPTSHDAGRVVVAAVQFTNSANCL